MNSIVALARMRAPLLGGVSWLLAVAAGTAGLGGLTLVDALLLLAVLVVVPAAAPLHPAGDARAAGMALAAGLPVAPALLLDQGGIAGALVLPWVGITGVAALAVLRRWWTGERDVRGLVWVAAAGYLAFGALWLLADRLALEPGGFGPPIVQLTSVHFHYAGFASALLAGCVWRHRPHDRTAAAACALVVAAPPVVALGFAFVGWLQIAGAALLAVGLWLLAWVMLRRVVPATGGPARWLLALSALAVVVPMLLAVQWAVGANLGTPALSIPDMARYHGIANAVGFALLGVLGWRLAPTPRVGT